MLFYIKIQLSLSRCTVHGFTNIIKFIIKKNNMTKYTYLAQHDSFYITPDQIYTDKFDQAEGDFFPKTYPKLYNINNLCSPHDVLKQARSHKLNKCLSNMTLYSTLFNIST